LIFVDSNIPMYLIGAAHPHKAEAQVILERLIASGQRLVTDVEVLQEILHRYTAIDRREAIGPAFQVTLDIVDEVISIERAEVLRAGEIVQNRIVL
jgi:predicted nucleic acid-binding protein